MQSTKPDKISAPYGQACVHCVKAKSRCMLRTGGNCERLVRPLMSTSTHVDTVDIFLPCEYFPTNTITGVIDSTKSAFLRPLSAGEARSKPKPLGGIS
jgi:hypothetical protein